MSCTLPQLPDNKFAHTADSGLLCGGLNCTQWNSGTGTWEKSHSLDEDRYFHVSWTFDGLGTFLIGGLLQTSGGLDTTNTSTLVTTDGSQNPGFSLKYAT